MKYNQVISIFGVPRSGTTWLGEIFNSSPNVRFKFQPLHSYQLREKYSILDFSLVEIDEVIKDISSTRGNYVNSPIKHQKNDITFLVWKEVRFHNVINYLKQLKTRSYIIYIFRNPEDVLLSWLNSNEFKENQLKFENFFNPITSNITSHDYFGIQGWKRSFNIIKKNISAPIILIDYDDLKANPNYLMERLFSKISLEFSKQVNDFINYTSSKSSVRNFDKIKNNFFDKKDYDVLAYKKNMQLIKLPENVVSFLHKDKVILDALEFYKENKLNAHKS